MKDEIRISGFVFSGSGQRRELQITSYERLCSSWYGICNLRLEKARVSRTLIRGPAAHVFCFILQNSSFVCRPQFTTPVVGAIAIELSALDRIVIYRKRLFTSSLGNVYKDEPAPAVQTLDLNA
jgi:hypothetical protein